MQVKESVNAANLLLVGAGMDISAVKPDVNNVANFADYFDKAQNNNAIAGTNVKDSKSQNAEVQKSQNQDSKAYNAQGKGQTENVDNRAVDNKAVDNQTVDNGMSETVPDDANVSDVETAEQMTDFGETELVEEAVIQIPELSDEEMESVLEILGSLLQTVTEQFQFPVQELTDKLKEFDMEPKDLLSEEGLKKFFLQMNSAEVSDLIVDEVLNQDLQSFVAEADSLLQQIDSELPQVLPEQQMEDLLVEALSIVQEPAEITEVVEEVPYVRSNAPVGEVPEVEEEEPQEQQVVKEITEEPEVIVTNERHSESKGNQTASKEHESEGLSEHRNMDSNSNVERSETKKQELFQNPILQAIEDAIDQTSTLGETEAQPVRQVEVIQQIVEQVKVHMSQSTTSMEMQLYPEHLGRIQINVVSKDGVMTARIVAENEAAKQAIEGGLTNLKEAMQQQDLKVEAIEVMVSTTGFERGDAEKDSAAENRASKNRKKIDLSELEDDAVDEEAIEVEKMRAAGSSVSYSA
ncbi:MAG: flagellar hook-length control protein FliK [Lachnospiraceae bacterium]|nr:flagellar hook-length control protein FliK [Lachnospiraceae bacterium]